MLSDAYPDDMQLLKAKNIATAHVHSHNTFTQVTFVIPCFTFIWSAANILG